MRSIQKNKILGVLLGTIVEYYDYSLYGFSASVIAINFFPSTDILTSLAHTFAIYAVAYLAKPLGSVIFGYVGDRFGRKIALNFTILGMVIPTAVIGCLPVYSTLGIWGTVILVLCRFTQGIFMAGEYDGAAIYVIEHLGSKYQYTASAITRTTGVIGLLLGIGTSNLFKSHIFPEWGWRIPFLLSLPLALATLYYRKQLIETPDFQNTKRSQVPLRSTIDLCKSQWKFLLMAVLIAGGFGVTYQISIVLMKQYLPIVLPQSSSFISILSIFLVILLGVSMLMSGLCADRFGVAKVMRISVFVTIIACMLLSIAITYKLLQLALISCLLLAIAIAPFNGLAHGILIQGFEIKERYRSISLGHSFGSMVMSGAANYICLMFMKSFGWHLFPVIYVAVFAVLFYISISIYQNQLSQ